MTEVFGKDVVPGESAEVGIGLKQIRDPDLAQDFAAPRLPIDVAELPRLRRGLGPRRGGRSASTARRYAAARDPPAYPLQLMVAVFDFPEWSPGDDDHLVPELVVDRIRS